MPAKLKTNDDYNGFVKIDIKITSLNRGNKCREKGFCPLNGSGLKVPPYN